MVYITAIAINFYLEIIILIFPASCTPKMSLFITSYPIARNGFGHTAKRRDETIVRSADLIRAFRFVDRRRSPGRARNPYGREGLLVLLVVHPAGKAMPRWDGEGGRATSDSS